MQPHRCNHYHDSTFHRMNWPEGKESLDKFLHFSFQRLSSVLLGSTSTSPRTSSGNLVPGSCLEKDSTTPLLIMCFAGKEEGGLGLQMQLRLSIPY